MKVCSNVNDRTVTVLSNDCATIENAKKAIVIAFGSNVRASVIFNLRTDGMPAQNEDDIKIIKTKS